MVSVLLALALVALPTLGAVTSARPAAAADDDPADLAVTLTALTPVTLTPGQPVTLTGTVENRNDFTWTNLQAYLVIPRTPFTTRSQVTQAVADDAGYTGARITQLDTFDNLGDLAPEDETTFTVTVPWASLGITGAEGVYPLGIQLLGTRPDGERLNRAVGRATTFAPLTAPDRPAVPTSVLWSFAMPIAPVADGTYPDAGRLVEAVGEDGRLRNLLDLVETTPVAGSTIVLDPALLDGLTAIADGRGLPADVELSEAETDAVETFAADLVDLARRVSTWVIGYGAPDQQALSMNPETSTSLRQSIDRATSDALATHGITGRRATWVGPGALSPALLAQLRQAGDQPFIVDSSNLPGWSTRDGSLLRTDTTAGPVPMLVDDDLSAGVPGAATALTLRQRILTESALAGLQRQIDPDSRADAVTVVPPDWDPGPQWRAADFSALWSAPGTVPTTPDDLLLQPLSTYEDDLPLPTATPISGQLLASVLELQDAISTLDAISVDEAASTDLARSVAWLVGTRWRGQGPEAIAVAREARSRIEDQLAAVTIEGPPSFILSGSEGQVPLTIANPTDRTIRVGIQIRSTNPQLQVPDIEPVDIPAGARNTVNVVVDVGQQSTTSLTASLVTANGEVLGNPAQFNVRSSNASTVIWVAMGFAAALVVLALARRFVLPRRSRAGDQDDEPEPDETA